MSSSITDAFARRYGEATPPPVGAVWNETLDLLLAHRSVRSFTDRPLPAGTLEVLTAAAQSAASSSNLQVFSVVAVEDAARRDRLATLARSQAHVRQAPLLLAWVADLSRIEALARATGRPAEGLEFLEAFLVAAIDTALAAQNAAIALESLGLSCCYIGALRNRPLEVASELGLPGLSVALFGMCVGHADPAHPADVKPRLPQRLVLHRERYDAASAAAGVAEYDAVMGRFYAEQGLPQPDWSKHVVARVASAASLHGREHLAAILNERGFRLR